MDQAWWNQIIYSVADRGRELLNINTTESPMTQLKQMCRDLLSGSGEARGTALAREVVRAMEKLDERGWGYFLETLHSDYGPNVNRLMAMVDAYRQNPNDKTLLALRQEVASPRQELFRRINLSPGGTQVLVRLREHLLRLLPKRPHLEMVDADLKDLFTAWFNRGFLELRHIDWRSPALILEKLINYESVHAIQGWDDLRRRLERDRRCYAFFHPALPDEPLIFVEVALMRGIPDKANSLVNPDTAILDPSTADSAIFYSINNCQFGLRGISFGNFLIKQVTTDLQVELPNLKKFATFSPVPRFAETLKRSDPEAPFNPQRLRTLLEDQADVIRRESGKRDLLEGFFTLLSEPERARAHLANALETLVLAYLVQVRRGKLAFDPVALFHLSNGARLERINALGDSSAERWDASFGVMVNYLYKPEQLERNHERFFEDGKVTLSRQLTKKLGPVKSAWGAS
ncbi:MAG: malonyl-CoA decarboxylase family protein [Magnetococcales bacterium]|nr:malonyl-CoA decarboxylase family protein [Magnetococcales bacterium]